MHLTLAQGLTGIEGGQVENGCLFTCCTQSYRHVPTYIFNTYVSVRLIPVGFFLQAPGGEYFTGHTLSIAEILRKIAGSNGNSWRFTVSEKSSGNLAEMRGN